MPAEAWANWLRSSSTERLLASSGDSRHSIGDGGRNRYGNRYRPEPGLVTLGSCTSSTLSAHAYGAAERMHHWLAALDAAWLPRAIDDLYEAIRTELTSHLVPSVTPAPAVVLTPSGTDAEYVPVLSSLARHARVTNILVGPSEAGSGSELAAAGLHFDHVTPAGHDADPAWPVDVDSAGRLETVTVPIRDQAGTPRDAASIDAEVRDIVRGRARAGHGVLLHVIAHSKTGVHAPTLPAVHEMVSSYPAHVDVVIDAAQGRFSRFGLQSVLDRGYMVITTGSKFFGGPPFAGAVIVPRSLVPSLAARELPRGFGSYLAPSMLPSSWKSRQSLPDWPNVGLALRWWAALTEMRTYYAVPARLRFDVLRALQVEVPRRLRQAPHLVSTTVSAPSDEAGVRRLLESNVTVFSFMCRDAEGEFLTQDGLSQVRALVRDAALMSHQDAHQPAVDVRLGSAEIGQPVPVGPMKSEPAYLRLAIGAREIVRASRCGWGDRAGMEGLLADIDLAVAMLEKAITTRRWEV